MGKIQKHEFNREMAPIEELIGDSNFEKLQALKDELVDTWTKAQIFRTETEMRMSVLNEGKHPTKASKYWQAVREQKGMFNSIMECGYNYRETMVKIKKIDRKMSKINDELELESLQIKKDRLNYRRACIIQEAEDRFREINLWSQIKYELDDGTFDTKNVDTHQSHSYELALENRRKMLTPGSSQAEAINVYGPLASVQKLNQAKGIDAGNSGPKIVTDNMGDDMAHLFKKQGLGESDHKPELAPLEERIRIRKQLGLDTAQLEEQLKLNTISDEEDVEDTFDLNEEIPEPVLINNIKKEGLKLPTNGQH